MEPRTTITPSQLVDESQTFPAVMIQAAKRASRSKMWRGTFEKRMEKIQTMGREIFAAFGVEEPWQIVHVGSKTGSSGASKIKPSLKRIQLTGRLSVVTVLQLIARVQGCDVMQSIRWSITLFSKCWPLSFSRCRMEGTLLVNDGRGD